VHLCDFPTPEQVGARDEPLEQAMALARETVRLGLGARGKAKIKVRQPLGEAVVVAEGREREAIERLVDVIRDELNVRRVRFVDGADELGSYEIKANYRALGPIFGSEMPRAAEAIAGLDPAHVAASLRDGLQIGISVGGRDHTLTSEELIITMRPPEGYSVEREGAHAVALDLEIDEDLREEGRAREIVHAVQNARKNAGLEIEDRITLQLDADAELLAAARAHRDYICNETLALDCRIGAGDGAQPQDAAYSETTAVEGRDLQIGLARCA
jgi:isoleucyl-tRNA synthetase